MNLTELIQNRLKERKAALPVQKGPPDGVLVPASLLKAPVELASVQEARSETMRIVNLPVVDYFGCDLTDELMKPGKPREWRDSQGSLIKGLLPTQSASLKAIQECKGAVIAAGVGHGKSGVGILAGTVLDAECVLFFTTATTLAPIQRTFGDWRKHFRMAPNVFFMTYDQLSSPKSTGLLRRFTDQYDPKRIVVVADEAHCLKLLNSSRTLRMMRLLSENPDVMFVPMSGTLTSKSLHDFAHLAEMALRHYSPVPRTEMELHAWASTIDVKGKPNALQWQQVQPLVEKFSRIQTPLENMVGTHAQFAARQAFQARFRAAPGVVATSEQSVGASLIIRGVDSPVPKEIADLILKVRKKGETPGGEVLPDDVSIWRAQRQLSAGFYYVWDWPDGIVDMEWMLARKIWHAAVRREQEENVREGYDSPFLIGAQVAREIAEGRGKDPIHHAYVGWLGQRDKRWNGQPTPPVKTVWVNDFLVRAVKAWSARQKEPVILWYGTHGMREALCGLKLFPVYGGGDDPPTHAHLCAMSIKSQGTGLNLQRWRKCLIVEPPSSGHTLEQLMGRTHRHGQEADEVEWEIFAHTEPFRWAIHQARTDARYIEDTTGNKQKLNVATLVDID